MIRHRIACAFCRRDCPTAGLEVVIVLPGVFLSLQAKNRNHTRAKAAFSLPTCRKSPKTCSPISSFTTNSTISLSHASQRSDRARHEQ